jgi:hypothetical protein
LNNSSQSAFLKERLEKNPCASKLITKVTLAPLAIFNLCTSLTKTEGFGFLLFFFFFSFSVANYKTGQFLLLVELK